jgi:hypothetical protein
MTLLDTIQTLSGGPLGWAGLVGAVAFAIRQTSVALKTRSEAKSKRLVAEAEAAALAAVEAARTEHTEAETAAMREATFAELLQEIRDLRERVDGLVSEVDTLRRAMRAAKIPTPPRGIPKAEPRGFTAPEAAPSTDSPDPQNRGPHR